MRRLPILAAMLPLALAACDMAPDYKPPVVHVAEDYEEAGPWHPALPADAQPHGDWWTLFGDATLDRLEAEIDQSSPTLAAAVARLDQARAYAAQAEAGLYPEVSAGGASAIDRQSQSGPLMGGRQGAKTKEYSANKLDLQASYELDFWGRIRNQAAAGRDLAQASEADLATIKLSEAAELAADYLTLRGLDNDIDVLSDTVLTYRKARDLTRTLYQGAAASRMDVSRAETQLDLAEAQLADTEARRALIDHAIAALMGKTPAEQSIAPATPDIALPDVPPGVPSALLQRRPDIAAAERRVAAANAGIGVAKAAFYPSLTLGLLGGEQSNGAQLVGLPNSFWTLGPGVTLPIFTGGRLEAQEDQAYASFREEGELYRATVITAFREVEDNLALLSHLGEEAAKVEAGSDQAHKTLDIAMTLYKDGADSYLDVVTAQTTYLQTRLTAVDVRTRRMLAEVGLIRALGGGWKA